MSENFSSPERGGGRRSRSEGRPVLAASGKAIRLAKILRREMSLPERMLWVRLRGRKGEERWRKQHPCGAYVLDLFQPAARLAVEVDGISHDRGRGPRGMSGGTGGCEVRGSRCCGWRQATF